MIIYRHGDLFTSEAEAIVNPVNCVGVMGAGLALAFKERFPANFEAYAVACRLKRIKIGEVTVFELPEGSKPKYIINFPTKIHWKDGSDFAYIHHGLCALTKAVKGLKLSSIAIPRLGCGHGGLSWRFVKPVIEKHFEGLDQVNVIIYE